MFQVARLTCVCVLGSLALMALALNIQTTGMVGLASGQTARLNLLNPGIQAPAMGIICTAQVSFVDSDGASLKSDTLAVIPGKSASLDLSGDSELNLAMGDRRQIRALITIPAIPASSPNAGAPSCTVIPTLEIFDSATGRTVVTLSRTSTVPSLGLN